MSKKIHCSVNFDYTTVCTNYEYSVGYNRSLNLPGFNNLACASPDVLRIVSRNVLSQRSAETHLPPVSRGLRVKQRAHYRITLLPILRC